MVQEGCTRPVASRKSPIRNHPNMTSKAKPPPQKNQRTRKHPLHHQILANLIIILNSFATLRCLYHISIVRPGTTSSTPLQDSGPVCAYDSSGLRFARFAAIMQTISQLSLRGFSSARRCGYWWERASYITFLSHLCLTVSSPSTTFFSVIFATINSLRLQGSNISSECWCLLTVKCRGRRTSYQRLLDVGNGHHNIF